MKITIFLKFIMFIVFVIFFSLIGVNKKLIDSTKNNNLNEIQSNVNSVRGLLWTNFAFINLSLIISLYFIISKRYYIQNKWFVISSVLFILLNTGLTIYEEIILKNIVENNEYDSLNNIYIITCIMTFVFFITIVKLINSINSIYSDYDKIDLMRINRFNRDVMNIPFTDDDLYEISVSTPSMTDDINYNENFDIDEFFENDKIYGDDDIYINNRRRISSF
jgi:hypothetical protein